MHSTNNSRYIIYFSIILLLFACNEEFKDFIENDSNISFLTTNNISTNSRSNNYETLLATEKILFNSTGNIIINDETFIYNNQEWVCESNKYLWDRNVKKKLFITALYPLPHNKSFTEDELYNNNSLKDILIAKDTIEYKGKINLTFKHLFSRITFILTDEIKEDLQNISIVTPYCVESIDNVNGNIKTYNKEVTSLNKINNNNSCSFTLPPTENTTIKISLKYSTEERNYEITSTNFQSNTNYICTIARKKKINGIRTEDEFILFCKYINKRGFYKDKLSLFGDTVDGRMVYKLLKDLSFNEEQSKKLIPIGQERNGFDDIFDGQGHSINNLMIDYSYNNGDRLGLFMKIDKTGIVKNLTFYNPTINKSTINEEPAFAAFISCENSGIIDNCIIKEGSIIITNGNENYYSCISSYSTGIIVNCGIESSHINTSNNEKIGGVIASGCGTIINCYIADFIYRTGQKNFIFGGIINKCDEERKTKIINCYSDVHTYTSNKSANFVGEAYKLHMENCFYSNQNKKNIGIENLPKEITLIDVLNYNIESMINDTSLVDKLNEWVENNQSSYKDFTLRKWVKGNNLIPAIIQQ